MQDSLGNAVTTASEEALRLVESAIDLHARGWPGALETAEAAASADPDLAIAYALQALIHGMIKLQEKIDRQSIGKVRWYRKGPDSVEIPVPILGPDLIDPRRNPEIKDAAAATASAATQEGALHGDNASSH